MNEFSNYLAKYMREDQVPAKFLSKIERFDTTVATIKENFDKNGLQNVEVEKNPNGIVIKNTQKTKKDLKQEHAKKVKELENMINMSMSQGGSHVH